MVKTSAIGKYSRKHRRSGAVINEAVRREFLRRGLTGKLPCAIAFDICAALGVSPREVGQTADLMDLPLVKCQLGLFGYAPRKKIVSPLPVVDAPMKQAIEAELKDDRLACKTAWQIAEDLGVHKLKIARACETLHVKIAPCQLGAF